MYSKYERRTDTRTYDDRRKLYEGVSFANDIIMGNVTTTVFDRVGTSCAQNS